MKLHSTFILATFCVLLLSATSCASLKDYSIRSGYDEKSNSNLKSISFNISIFPYLDILQIYKSTTNTTGVSTVGIYNNYSTDGSNIRPDFSALAFIVDGKRTDFYAKSYGSEYIDLHRRSAKEKAYFFSNKPILGNSSVASDGELITDPDPAATEAALLSLLKNISSSQSVTIKLFGNATGTVNTLSYELKTDTLAAFKAFSIDFVGNK